MPYNKKTKKLSFTKTKFNKTGLFVTMLVFGVVGVWLLLRSYAATPRISVSAPVIAIAQAGANNKYWLATSDGSVYALPTGSGQTAAPFYGSMGGKPLNQPITAMVARPQHDGYWLLGGDGGVFAFGGAAPYNAHPTLTTTSKFYRAIVPTPTGNGYYVVGALGEITPEGDAVNGFWNIASSGHNSIAADYSAKNTGGLASIPGIPSGGIVSAAVTSTGRGMYLLLNTVGVYTYGDAVYRGWASYINFAGGERATAITAYGAGSSGGYIIATSKGNVSAYNAPIHGNVAGTNLAGPIVSIAYTPGAQGYWLAGQDGGIFALGDAVFQQALKAPTVAPKPTTSTAPTAKSTVVTPTPSAATNPSNPITAASLSSGSVAGTPTPQACAKLQPPLTIKSNGNCVTLLQHSLNVLIGNRLGALLSEDGNYGIATFMAVCGYEQGNTIDTSATAEAQLWFVIANKSPKFTPCTSGIVSEGSSSVSATVCAGMVAKYKASAIGYDSLTNINHSLAPHPISALNSRGVRVYFNSHGSDSQYGALFRDLSAMDQETKSSSSKYCVSLPSVSDFTSFYNNTLPDFKTQSSVWTGYLNDWTNALKGSTLPVSKVAR